MRGHHLIVGMLAGIAILRIVVAGRSRSDDSFGRHLWMLNAGWLRERLWGLPVSRIVLLWVASCLSSAALIEWLNQ